MWAVMLARTVLGQGGLPVTLSRCGACGAPNVAVDKPLVSCQATVQHRALLARDGPSVQGAAPEFALQVIFCPRVSRRVRVLRTSVAWALFAACLASPAPFRLRVGKMGCGGPRPDDVQIPPSERLVPAAVRGGAPGVGRRAPRGRPARDPECAVRARNETNHQHRCPAPLPPPGLDWRRARGRQTQEGTCWLRSTSS